MHDHTVEATSPSIASGLVDELVLLPARETLFSVGSPTIVTVVGVNLAIAVNAASIHSSANAYANQYVSTWVR